jgi:hypothetical protein
MHYLITPTICWPRLSTKSWTCSVAHEQQWSLRRFGASKRQSNG